MSIWHIYMLGSTRVHKHLRHPCMPEYGSESWTLCLYVCICICDACKRYLSMELSVMKIIGVDFIVVWIFCSFNDVFISSYSFKMFWKLIGLLNNYHNRLLTLHHFPFIPYPLSTTCSCFNVPDPHRLHFINPRSCDFSISDSYSSIDSLV